MADKALEFATNLIKRGTEVAKQQARVLQIQAQISRLREQKTRLLLQMGQKVYALYEKDLVKNADLLAFCKQAEELDLEMARKEQEIEDVRRGQPEETGIAEEPATKEPDTAAPPPADAGLAFLRDAPPAGSTPEAPYSSAPAPEAPAPPAPPSATNGGGEEVEH
jgi:hypothetical protein